jgi:hypothetical protein
MFATRRIFAAARLYRARGRRMTGLGVIAVVAAGIAASATAFERLPVLSLKVAEKAASAVSGCMLDKDEFCAQAGLDAIRDLLK